MWQGPMSKPKAPAAAKEPAPAPAPTSTTTTTTSSSSSRASANVAAGGGGQGKGGDSGSSPAGYVPFDFAARQPRLVSSPAPPCSRASSLLPSALVQALLLPVCALVQGAGRLLSCGKCRYSGMIGNTSLDTGLADMFFVWLCVSFEVCFA